MAKWDKEYFEKAMTARLDANTKAIREASIERGKKILEARAKGKMPEFMQRALDQRPQAGEYKAGNGQLFARSIAGVLAAKQAGSMDAGCAFVEKAFGKGAENESVIKSLQAGEISGAVWVTPTISNDFIPLLTAATAVRALNPEKESLEGGTVSIRKETGDLTSSYRGENQPKNASKQTFGWVTLVEKELITKVAFSNKLLRQSGGDIESRVTSRAKNRMSRREDIAFIRGDGSQNTPKGLRYWAAAANIFAADTTGSTKLDKIDNDISAMELALRGKDVLMERPGLIWAPRTEINLKKVRTADGAYAFREEILGGTLNGWPFRSTSQVPINLGSAETEVYLADFSLVVLGDVPTMSIMVSNEASYTDESGNIQSAFDNDETVIRLISGHDLGVHQEEGICVLTGVTW